MSTNSGDAKKDMVKRLGRDPKDFFLTRDLVHEKFKDIQKWGEQFTLFGTPVYLEFLAGKRELPCSAWAIPTYNVRGWKAPCYVMTETHFGSYQEVLTKVDWEKYGTKNGVALNPKCENCMMHSGYEPSGALSTSPRDTWVNMKFNFASKPKPYPASAELTRSAYNGATIGKGHLAEAKAAVNREMSSAKPAYQRNGDDDHHHPDGGDSCGTSPEREALLAKVRETQRAGVKVN